MQKTLLSVLLVSLTFFGNTAVKAQALSTASSAAERSALVSKAQAGNVTLEGMYSLSNQSAPRGYLRGRVFIKENIAFRAGLGYSYTSQTPSNNSPLHFSSTATVRPGFEFHLGNSERFSPYIGFEYAYQYNKGGQRTQIGLASGSETATITTQHGVGVVSGADYYFAKNFYLGLEFSYMISGGSIEAVEGPNRSTTHTFFEMGQGVNGALRVGFAF